MDSAFEAAAFVKRDAQELEKMPDDLREFLERHYKKSEGFC